MQDDCMDNKFEQILQLLNISLVVFDYQMNLEEELMPKIIKIILTLNLHKYYLNNSAKIDVDYG